VKEEQPQQLHEIKNFLFVVIKAHTDPLGLLNQLVEQLLALDSLPVIRPLELVLDLLGALPVHGGVAFYE
jgi:hypothetical protein